jgi:hypothetical protein
MTARFASFGNRQGRPLRGSTLTISNHEWVRYAPPRGISLSMANQYNSMRITLTSPDGSRSCGMNLLLCGIDLKGAASYLVFRMHPADVEMVIEALDLCMDEWPIYSTQEGFITWENDRWSYRCLVTT